MSAKSNHFVAIQDNRQILPPSFCPSSDFLVANQPFLLWSLPTFYRLSVSSSLHGGYDELAVRSFEKTLNCPVGADVIYPGELCFIANIGLSHFAVFDHEWRKIMKRLMAAAIIALCSFGAVASTASVGPSAGPLYHCTAEELSSLGSSGFLAETVLLTADKRQATNWINFYCLGFGHG